MGEILSRDPVIATSSLEDIPVALMLRPRPSGCPHDIEKGTGVIAIAIAALDMMLICIAGPLIFRFQFAFWSVM